MPLPTEKTRVLMSFGAVDGGFEFGMQLRLDIYQKFGKNADADPAFCYLDAESLRVDSTTKYTYDLKSDKIMMENPDWDKYYESAMKYCKTMILLITKQWLTSKWCWKELDMLVHRRGKFVAKGHSRLVARRQRFNAKRLVEKSAGRRRGSHTARSLRSARQTKRKAEVLPTNSVGTTRHRGGAQQRAARTLSRICALRASVL